MNRLPEDVWNFFVENLEAHNKYLFRLKMKWDLLDNTDQFYYDVVQEIGAGSVINDLFQEIETLSFWTDKLNNAYSAAKNGTAGVRITKLADGNDDFNIVSITGKMSESDIQASSIPKDQTFEATLQGLGIAPAIIAAGIGLVLVSGTLITLFALKKRETEIEAEVDKQQMKLEEKLLANPSVIDQWTQYKQSVQGNQRGLIESIFGSGTGKTLLSGAAGIAIFAVGGYILMKALEKRKTA